MTTISDTALLCRLPSGNKAIYLVQPQHMNDRPGTTLNSRAIEYGSQVAHEHGGRWFKVGSWDEITDLRTLALIERAPQADLLFAVLTDGEDLWTDDTGEDGPRPTRFASFEEAQAELDRHMADLDKAGMDYEPAEFRIVEVRE